MAANTEGAGELAHAAKTGIVLQGTFVIRKALHDVFLEDDVIKWRHCAKTGPQDFVRVALKDVVRVTAIAATAIRAPDMTLHYVTKKPNHCWIVETTTFLTSGQASATLEDIEGFGAWAAHIQRYCSRLSERPRRLLVFINPASGSWSGESIYRKKAAPLFELSGVKTDVIVTEHGGHPAEVLQEYDLSTIDGIVSVGGDGSFLQCYNGLLLRTAKDAGKDLNDASQDPVAPSVPIGIIPAGSGQGMVKDATLTDDPITAALHIITGQRYRIHLYSVYNAGKLLSFGSMLVAYGLLGDAIGEGEALRKQLGRARYLVSIFNSLVKKRIFDAEIRYRTLKNVPQDQEASKSKEEDGDCGVSNVNTSSSHSDVAGPAAASAVVQEGWEVVKGSFSGIVSFICTLGPMNVEKRLKQKLISPPDPAVPTTDVYRVAAACPRRKIMKAMGGMWTGDKSAFTNEHIEKSSTLEYMMEIQDEVLNDGNNWLNIDGEAHRLQDRTVHVRSHANLLSVYGSGLWNIVKGD